MPKVIEKRLIEEFKDREAFSREELFDFYRCFEPDLKEGTLGWRIYDLKEKNIIKTVKRGLYKISYRPRYKPEISPELFKLGKKIGAKFEEVKFCIWDTSWLNEFLQHQSSKLMMIAEIEKGFEESLYYELKDNFKNEIYLNPHEREINLYITESRLPIVIKKLVTRSPLDTRIEKKVKLPTPQLEKILVDLFAEEKLFFYLQGSEMIHLYENALNNYSINFTRLFSYAKRRERDQEIKQFMSNHLLHLVKDFIDD